VVPIHGPLGYGPMILVTTQEKCDANKKPGELFVLQSVLQPWFFPER